MKKLVILILLACAPVFSQSAGKLFDEANELYRKDKFEEAAELYERIVSQKKVHSAAVYFNLANSYYKLNRIAPAVYNYERALLLDPSDADIRTNLGFAHKMMIDEVHETPVSGFGDIVSRFTSILSYNGWAVTAVAFSFLSLLLFCGYYFSGTTLSKRIFFVSMLIAALLLVVSIISAVFEKSRWENIRPAIVFEGIASVRSEPKPTASEGATIHEGTKVYVMDELDNWRRVRLPDGNDGWIEASAIKEIKFR